MYIMFVFVMRLEKLAEVFYTYVGDVKMTASVVELDTEAVDMVYHYWLLKRKVIVVIITVTLITTRTMFIVLSSWHSPCWNPLVSC